MITPSTLSWEDAMTRPREDVVAAYKADGMSERDAEVMTAALRDDNGFIVD